MLCEIIEQFWAGFILRGFVLKVVGVKGINNFSPEVNAPLEVFIVLIIKT